MSRPIRRARSIDYTISSWQTVKEFATAFRTQALIALCRSRSLPIRVGLFPVHRDAELAGRIRLAQTLYDCFDAKVRSELAPGVGYDWEMRLITCAGAVSLHTNPKALLESVWSKFNRSPFEKREEDDPPEPPDDWETQLRTLVATSLQGCEPDQIRSIDEIAEGGA